MAYRLSLLDKSPIADGRDAADALATTIAYAELADRLGYHRFWVAEHHGTPALASAAPEALVAHLLARTRRIRIGTGGILLQHYSPYKIAELFGVLANLAPGRVDLGIGKAPGGLPAGTRALQAELAQPRVAFNRKLADLDAFLRGALPADHPLAGAEALPRAGILPERFLLGASEDTARTAARLGWDFVHAGHQDGDRQALDRALDAHGGGRRILAVAAYAAPTAAEARDTISAYSFYRLILPDGQRLNLQTEDAAREYARQLGVEPLRIEERHPEALIGTPEEIHAALNALAARHRIDEFVIDQPVAEPALRLRSIELIARAADRAAA